VERRVCDSCRFFEPTGSSLLGICGHPDHQFSGITPLVRAGELRCRRSFVLDDWKPASGIVGAPGQDILISERPAPYHRQRTDLPIGDIDTSGIGQIND